MSSINENLVLIRKHGVGVWASRHWLCVKSTRVLSTHITFQACVDLHLTVAALVCWPTETTASSSVLWRLMVISYERELLAGTSFLFGKKRFIQLQFCRHSKAVQAVFPEHIVIIRYQDSQKLSSLPALCSAHIGLM